MGKYNEYAKRLDTLARQRFSDYEKAVAEFEKAKKAKTETPMRSGWGVTPEYQLKAKKAEVKYLEAEAVFKEAKAAYLNTLKESDAIRAELLDEVSRAYSVNPEDLDRNVVDLLKSGICSAEEIAGLFEKSGNSTTRRYIAKFASDMDKDRLSSEDRMILNNVIHSGVAYNDPEQSDTILRFDSVNEVLRRCINNPALSSHWGELTEDTLSEI